ncbi:MAG: alkaline phosphatase family protein, partial [Myxococcales bacterium]
LVVDQLGFETLQRMRRHFGRGGFERLAAEGASFQQAHYGHLTTFTGPGHACISSGSYPHRNGIVANRIHDRGLGRAVTMLFDPSHPILEAAPDPEDDTSPAAFTGETLADRLRAATGMRGKVVAIALKDRAAVLLAGRLGQAYWFSEQTGRMTTSTWYTKELPAWVKAFNARAPADQAFGRRWERALPEKAYTGEDHAAWELDQSGLGTTFPHKVDGGAEKPGPSFYRAFAATPFGLELQLEFARAAIEAEGLGRDEVPDLLALSFTSTDYAGHLYGPDSHEVQDLLVRLDRALAALLPVLEKAAGGRANLVLALTADHGAAPVPEYMASLGHPAARIGKQKLVDAINAALRPRFGEGEWVTAIEEPSVYLNAELIRARKLDPALVQQAAGQAAVAVPGMEGFFTRASLESGTVPQTPLGRAAQLSFHPAHSGDLLLFAKPFYLWGRYADRAGGTGHGTPWRYDTHVPLLFWGGGIRAGVHADRADVADVAPSLSALLGIGAPAAAEGQALPQLFR